LQFLHVLGLDDAKDRADGKVVINRSASTGDAVGAVGAVDAILTAIGALAGHYCDAPLQFGFYAGSYDVTMHAREGRRFTSKELSSALLAVGANQGQALDALHASEELERRVHASDVDRTRPTTRQMRRIYAGATGSFTNADHAASEEALQTIGGLVAMARADARRARAYLRGVAAHCVMVLGARLDARIDYRDGARTAERALPRKKANALGRLSARSERTTEPMIEPDVTFRANASVVTLQQLAWAATSRVASFHVEDPCTILSEQLFTEDADSAWFRLVVSDELYEKMRRVVDTVRHALVDLLKNDPVVRSAVRNPDAMAVDVERVLVRIPGAPRGSWAGAAHGAPNVDASADVSAWTKMLASSPESVTFAMALQQARRIFLMHVDDYTQSPSLRKACDALPLPLDALSANAFIYPAQRCSYFLLGMAMPPWAGTLYDDESLTARFGYIVAHEMAHTSANRGLEKAATHDGLLKHYAEHTNDEAIADVLALLTVVQTGKVDARAACAHSSQLWCARTSLEHLQSNPRPDASQTHPAANKRGDAGCATLSDLGFEV
jgi:hypothetical protein